MCGLDRFWEINPKSDLIRQFSILFFLSICSFNLDQFEFEHPYEVQIKFASAFTKLISINTIIE
jgi:hypothetical protein